MASTSHEKILQNVKTFIELEIFNYISIKRNLVEECHNHPPMRVIVEDCPYCKKHGNVLTT